MSENLQSGGGEKKVISRVDFSDHHPILIYLLGLTQDDRLNKFHFECAWVTHSNYKEFLDSMWNGGASIIKNVAKLESGLCVWKRELGF